MSDTSGAGGARLLPCPFCGCTDISDSDCSDMQQNGTALCCSDCGACVSAFGAGDSRRKAIERWNRRAESRAEGRDFDPVEMAMRNTETATKLAKTEADLEQWKGHAGYWKELYLDLLEKQPIPPEHQRSEDGADDRRQSNV